MKDKRKFHPFLGSFVIFLLLVLVTTAAGIGLFYGIFSVPEPEGISLASWPRTFTDSFSAWMKYEDGEVKIEETGLARLEEYGLWIQVIDEAGEEIFSHNKPDNVPAYYPASALTELSMSAYTQGNTVFVNSWTGSGGTCSYIIGFPYAIGKYVLYYNGERISRLMPTAKVIVIFTLIVLAFLFFGYVFWLTRKLAEITGGISGVSLRTYEPLREKGMFSDIYGALNKMDMEIRRSDKIKEETERTRREWIANITHDLKTPLSPVKGYAELLADTGNKEGMEPETVREYGEIILKNVFHVEKLLNDLKLTWQLESGAVPCDFREVRIVRYLRELAVDIINDPVFSERRIEFEDHGEEFLVSIDPDLFRRAIQNIIVNALIHNPPETAVTIAVEKSPEDVFGDYKNASQGVEPAAVISIRDNGSGMDEAAQARLFDRYYRGTNTREKTEGSGLGLAIAGQIITLHGGEIRVKSELGVGTEFVIGLCKQE